MKSEQVLLSLMAVMILLLAGCTRSARPRVAQGLQSPYGSQQLWAVVPLRNESGSLQADGLVIADHLARQLENVKGIDVIAVNRVLAAMQAMRMAEVASAADARQLLRVLQVDALVVGTVTAYEPYDPPKLGLAVELYVQQRSEQAGGAFDTRGLTRAATDELSRPSVQQQLTAPTTAISGFFDAASPNVRQQLVNYGENRGGVADDADSWRLYRISMDLYTEFVSYLVSSRLMQAETKRLAPPPPPTTMPAS